MSDRLNFLILMADQLTARALLGLFAAQIGVADLVKGLTVGTGGSAYPNGGGGWLADSNLPASGGAVIFCTTVPSVFILTNSQFS